MLLTDVCRHCGFAVPHDAATCPGCTRQHLHVSVGLRPLMALAGPLRSLLAATGVAAFFLAVALAARLAVRIEGPASDLDGTIDVLVGWCVAVTALAVVVTAAAAVAWAVGIHRVLLLAGVPEGRWTRAVARLGWRRSLWLCVPAVAFTVTAVAFVWLDGTTGVSGGDVATLAAALLLVGASEAGRDLVDIVTIALARDRRRAVPIEQ